MLPELSAFTFTLSTWALFAAAATVLGVVASLLVGRAKGFATGFLVELALVVVLAGWLGAKVAHVLFEAHGHAFEGGGVANGVVDLLREDPWHWARLFEPGFVFYGGVFGAVAGGLLFLHRRGEGRVAALCDVAVPGILTGIVIGRLGCLLGGCCFGAETSVPWAVHFPLSHQTYGVGVHPVQLYDAVVAAIALAAWTRLRRLVRTDGALFFAFCGYYAFARGLTELVRADSDRGAVGALSTSQLISIIVLAGLLVWGLNWTRRRRR